MIDWAGHVRYIQEVAPKVDKVRNRCSVVSESWLQVEWLSRVHTRFNAQSYKVEGDIALHCHPSHQVEVHGVDSVHDLFDIDREMVKGNE
jgi:hypothetical protein